MITSASGCLLRRRSAIRLVAWSRRAPLATTSHGDESSSSGAKTSEWRKHQLDSLQSKFSEGRPEPLEIISDDELQPMWKAMESRVLHRRSLTLEERGGKSGRSNIRKTDEEAWLQAGLYDGDGESSRNTDT